MTRSLALAVGLCWCLASLISAQDKKAEAELTETIVKLEKQVVDLFQKRKTDALKTILADDFIEVTSEGRRGKAAVFKELEAARDQPLDQTICEFSQVKLSLVTPDVALLTYHLEIKDPPTKPADKSEPKAPPKKAGDKAAEPEVSEPVTQHISSLWVKRNGRWLNAFYQSTPNSSEAE